MEENLQEEQRPYYVIQVQVDGDGAEEGVEEIGNDVDR